MNGNRRSIIGTISVLLVLTCFAAQGYAAEQAGEPLIPTIRYVSAAPVMDGKLNDSAWEKADILTGFTVPGDMNIARDQSEARIVFDEKRIYIGLKAYESTTNLMVYKGKNVFDSESFEIFIQPDPGKDTYYQVAVSVGGDIYTGEMSSPAWKPDIEVKTALEGNAWTVELAVPFADMKMAAPPAGEEKKIRFNICRNDHAAPGDKSKWTIESFSSFAPLEILNFGLPETWSDGIMTRTTGTPHTVVNKSPRINLLVNPEFDLAEDNHPVGWNIFKDASRQETMAMSGEWIIRAAGNVYHPLQQDVKLTPGKTYTVRLKARRFGDATFGIGQMIKCRTKSGFRMEPFVWESPLTTDFRYYYETFTAREGTERLIFYRLGPMTSTDGMDIASIHLFEGKISPFEIRKHARSGLNKPIKDSELAIPPNFYGIKSEKLNVLAIAGKLQTTREYLEIFSGLNIEPDILITTGKNQDTYYTDSDPDLIRKRLDDNQYGLYMVGRVAISGPGEALVKKITANIEAGAGFVANTGNEFGNFKELLAKSKPMPVKTSHYLKTGLPIALYPQTNNPTDKIMEAKAGEGRIVVVDIDGGYNAEFKILLDNDSYGYITFPHQRYSSAWLARLIYYAADQTQAVISAVALDDGKAAVNCQGALNDAQLKWQVDDKNGKPVSGGTAAVKDNLASITLPRLTLAGQHALSLWLMDRKGAVLDYCALTVKHEGPEITACESAKEFYAGNEEGEFTIKIKNFDETMKLEWALEDFAGRILESGSVKAAETVNFKVSLHAVYTGLARLWVYLRSGETELDARRFAVYLPDRDKPRLLNDYNVGIWPDGCNNPDSVPYIDHQLEQIGIRAQSLAWPVPFVSFLNDGFGSGSSLGLGGVFVGQLNPPKNNIRQPSVSDPAVLKRMEESVKKQAKKDRKYGPVSTMVCDEPEDADYYGADEIDAHPESLKEYRKRMREKYGTIEKFNERCSTDYKSFDEIGLVLTKDARARKNFAEFIEWRNYNVDRWVEAFRLVSDSYHSQNPDVPVSMANSLGTRALGCNDFWKLLKNAGFGFSQEYTSMINMDNPIRNFDECYRSFRPDMRMWGWIGYSWSRQQAAFQPWWFALHRYGGFSWFAATCGDPGQPWFNLLDVPGLGLVERARLLKEGLSDSRLLDGLGKVFLEYDWKKRAIAVLYSQPSMLVAWCRSKEITRNELIPGSPYRDFFYSRHNIRYMLEELLYQYDFISPEQIQQGMLDSYKALILPHIEALSDNEVKLIKEFMEKGGIVITDIMPATCDELGTPRNESPFNALKDNNNLVVFDNIFNAKDVVQREKMLMLLNKSGIEPIVRCNDAAATYGREAMRFVKGDMNVYTIIRDYRRSSDDKEQQFVFPTEGHLYDLRAGKYIGKTNQISCVISNADTKVFGHYPYRVTGMEIDVSAKVQGGKDLVADIKLNTSTGKAGDHVFHIEVLPPKGEARWFMKRNVAAPEGSVKFIFRMARNDPAGKWTLRITDIMTGTTETKSFQLYY